MVYFPLGGWLARNGAKASEAMIGNAKENKRLPVYGDGLQKRDWLFFEEFCRAVWLALEKAPPGSIYKVSCDALETNLETVRAILQLLGKPESLITFVEDRPGHDDRYAWIARSSVPNSAGCP